MKLPQTPAYIYDKNTILRKATELKKCFPFAKLYFALKANPNKAIAKLLRSAGFNVEAVSKGEVEIAKSAGFKPQDITFTCGNLEEKELLEILDMGIRVHLDSLHQIEIVGKNRKNSDISIRVNLHIGAGGHKHIVTGGKESKFGVDVYKTKELKKLLAKYNLRLTTLHQHIGSNILDYKEILSGIKEMLKFAREFPEVANLEFGGGFGVPYKESDTRLDLERLSEELLVELSKEKKKYNISFEPGRFLVAESGELLVKVVDIKKNKFKTFIGVNSGMNHLIRPAMYDSYHQIVNLSRSNGKNIKADIVGNICESGDYFAKNRRIVSPEIGDILSIKNAGAYGYAMSSNYNSRPKPKEYLKTNNSLKLI